LEEGDVIVLRSYVCGVEKGKAVIAAMRRGGKAGERERGRGENQNQQANAERENDSSGL
jgi:hypothetical protein